MADVSAVRGFRVNGLGFSGGVFQYIGVIWLLGFRTCRVSGFRVSTITKGTCTFGYVGGYRICPQRRTPNR